MRVLPTRTAGSGVETDRRPALTGDLDEDNLIITLARKEASVLKALDQVRGLCSRETEALRVALGDLPDRDLFARRAVSLANTSVVDRLQRPALPVVILEDGVNGFD